MPIFPFFCFSDATRYSLSSWSKPPDDQNLRTRNHSSGSIKVTPVARFVVGISWVTLVFASALPVLANRANAAPLNPFALAAFGVSTQQRLQLVPPVPGGIVDNWRPPSSPYGPGNRGVDLRASVGEPVLSVGNGVVTFAGQVGGRLFVVIDIAGVKITLGFLKSILVKTGQSVRARDLVAYANGPVHVGARQGTTYIDPRPFFATKSVRLTR
jgi:murein DD-endopeptidase MepM/ murein hydrolase activator NlpD